MTDRRRNLLILLLVAGLLAASAAVIATKGTKLGLDLQGGVSLVYEASPTKAAPTITPDAIDRSIDIMRERVDQLGVAEPEIQRLGENQIDVSLPGATNVEDAIRQVGTTAQLFFYDWEKNVLGPDCKPDPQNQSVTGGQAAGRPGGGSVPYYGAVIRASRCDFKPDDNDTHEGQFYGVDDTAKKVVCGPQPTEQDLREACLDQKTRRPLKFDRAIKVDPGVIVVQAEGFEDPESDEERRLDALAQDSYFVVKDDPALRGTDIKNPEQQFDQGVSGAPNVTFEFTDSGADKWQQVTREIANRGNFETSPTLPFDQRVQHFAIVLDDQLVSTPFIDFNRNPDGIDGSTGSEISGGFTIKSAQRLADLLKTGALPLKLTLISQSQVSATLGSEALDEALVAAAIGFALVVLFLVVFYRVLGLVAVGALVLYGIYLFALIRLIPVTMTLPGMAGLALTIGVAADANIIIFERVKEEVAAGRSVSQALAQGYKRGLTAIIDANVVTLLTAFILFVLATAGVQGFALMLGLGTIVTLFSAVLATSAVLGAGGSKMLTRPGLVGARPGRKKRRFDFNGATKYMFSLSGVILLAGALAISTKGIEFGIDFDSGTRITTAFQQPVTEDQVRTVLERNGVSDAEVQRLEGSEKGPNTVQIGTEQLEPAEVSRITDALNDEFQIRGEPDQQSIGPTFGATVAQSAIIAVIASLLVIAVYIALRFEWKYAVTTAISLSHDLLITAGLYAVTGREVTSGTVAALLTVLGFSLYDTIIVSDRIRENTPRMPRATFSQICNRSMNEVIVRSLATVTCASLPILALYIFGGAVLQDFAFALLIGNISGVYSSIFISSPVLTAWKEREPMYRRRRHAQIEALGEVPAFVPDKFAVETPEQRKARKARRLTAPDDPERRVSKEEFDEMVADLHVDTAPSQTAVEEPDPTADATPEDLVMKDDKKPKRTKQPRNKRHGRPR